MNFLGSIAFLVASVAGALTLIILLAGYAKWLTGMVGI